MPRVSSVTHVPVVWLQLLHAPPLPPVHAVHFDVPACAAQYEPPGHVSPGSAQTSLSCFLVGVAHVWPVMPGADAQTSVLVTQSRLLVHAAPWAELPTKTCAHVELRLESVDALTIVALLP